MGSSREFWCPVRREIEQMRKMWGRIWQFLPEQCLGRAKLVRVKWEERGEKTVLTVQGNLCFSGWRVGGVGGTDKSSVGAFP